jgi:hypothetical protein
VEEHGADPPPVTTQIGIESSCLIQKKSDGLILSISMTVRDVTGTRRGSFLSGQATPGRKIGTNHDNPRG